MRVGIYARVSSKRQAQDQTIEQQLTRLQAYIQQQGWTLEEEHVYRDDGYSGASLSRPGLDRLRDQVAMAEFEVVVITAPDRLARKYIHQVLLIEEFERHGVKVEFVDRPMSDDPNDQLLLQIRGAVAEYERTLITERMRRGKLAKLRAGELLPWTRGHYGYRVDPDRPRDPAGIKLDEYEAWVVEQIFAWYLEEGANLYTVSKRLEAAGIKSPRGRSYWTTGSIRETLHDHAYVGVAYANRYKSVPAKRRRSPLLPVGTGNSNVQRAEDEWVSIPVPTIVSEEVYRMVAEKLSHNRQSTTRNTKHEYLLRGHISCGVCKLAASCRTSSDGYGYYVCHGRVDKLRIAEGKQCTTHYVPAEQLDDLVWADLCKVLMDPEQIAAALQRAQGGAWLPQELQARSTNLKQAMATIERQQERLLEAYLGGVIQLPELERKRRELAQKLEGLKLQQQQLDAIVRQRVELAGIADSIESFCESVRSGLENASFEQKRQLVELLIDRVVVTKEDVEIRYVMPISPAGSHYPFCQLCIDYLRGEPGVEQADGEETADALDARGSTSPATDPHQGTQRRVAADICQVVSGHECRGTRGSRGCVAPVLFWPRTNPCKHPQGTVRARHSTAVSAGRYIRKGGENRL